jgi:hypothetical protein
MKFYIKESVEVRVVWVGEQQGRLNSGTRAAVIRHLTNAIEFERLGFTIRRWLWSGARFADGRG